MPDRIRSRHDPIPAYALYGDPTGIPLSVHAETIRARSSGLDWRIAAHRHAALYQALWITSGRALASVEGVETELPSGSFAFLPPLVVHGYTFTPDTAGIVISIPTAILAAALSAAPGAGETLGRPILLPDHEKRHPDVAGEPRFLFEASLADHAGFALGRDTSLSARALLLALWFAREASGREDTRRPDLAVVQRFLTEIEASFTKARSVAEHARHVGVSVAHLGRLCRAATGRSPLGLIHDRRLIEAKRLIVYTVLPIAEIAERLGFESPGYFSRFFRSRTGHSPLSFRQAATQAQGLPMPATLVP